MKTVELAFGYRREVLLGDGRVEVVKIALPPYHRSERHTHDGLDRGYVRVLSGKMAEVRLREITILTPKDAELMEPAGAEHIIANPYKVEAVTLHTYYLKPGARLVCTPVGDSGVDSAIFRAMGWTTRR